MKSGLGWWTPDPNEDFTKIGTENPPARTEITQSLRFFGEALDDLQRRMKEIDKILAATGTARNHRSAGLLALLEGRPSLRKRIKNCSTVMASLEKHSQPGIREH